MRSKNPCFPQKLHLYHPRRQCILVPMRFRHFDGDGRARFVTFSTHRQLPVLTNHAFRQELANCIDTVWATYQFHLIGYVFIPEHVHLVLIPAENTNVGEIIGEIKRQSAGAIHRLLNSHAAGGLSALYTVRNGQSRFVLWKRRCYDHNYRSIESVWQKVNYCHNNPVKRKLVTAPEDWRWSSCRWYQGRCEFHY